MKKIICSVILMLILVSWGWAADVKISQLPEVTTTAPATDVLPIVAGGVTSKIKVANLLGQTAWTPTTAFTATPTVTAVPTITFTFASSTAVVATGSLSSAGVKVGQYIYNSTNDTSTYAKQIVNIAADGLTITLASSYTGTTGSSKAASTYGDKLTMTSDLTASVGVMYPVKWVIGGTTYYGVVSAIASNLLTICGPPFTGSVTALYFGDPTRVIVTYQPFGTTYEAVSSADLLGTIRKTTFIWDKAKVYLVKVLARTAPADAYTNGTVYPTVSGNNALVGNIVLSASATDFDSGISINPTYYAVSQGTALDVGAVAGTGLDAFGLDFRFVFVMP